MRALPWLWEVWARRDFVVGPVIGDFLLGPEARQQVGEFPPHTACVLEIGAVRGELVGIAGAADPDVNPAAAQYIQCRRALGDVQRVVDWRQNPPDAEPDTTGALAG